MIKVEAWWLYTEPMDMRKVSGQRTHLQFWERGIQLWGSSSSSRL